MKRLFIFLTIILAATSMLAQDYLSVEDLMKGDSRTLYEIIGIKKMHNGINLPRVYRNYLKKHHPEKKAADPATLLELTKVTFAYKVLFNANLRKIYDSQGLDGLKDKVRVPMLLPPMYDGDNLKYITKMHAVCSRDANLHMPLSEKKARHSGMVTLSYVLGTDNSISNIRVEESTGYPILDSLAINSLMTAAAKKAEHITPAYSLENGKPSESMQIMYVSLFQYGRKPSNYSYHSDFGRYQWGKEAYRTNSTNNLWNWNDFPYRNYVNPFSNQMNSNLNKDFSSGSQKK